MVRRCIYFSLVIVAAIVAAACSPESNQYNINRYVCNFEGAYWDALVDGNLNSDNIESGVKTYSWYDAKSDLMGAVIEPFPTYWEGAALSNYCRKTAEESELFKMQLYAYADAPYSGKNFLVCNGFMSECVELRFDSKTSFIESMMVANTTYSRIATGNGYRTADRPLGDNESIWIEAVGYLYGSSEPVATSKFYLYKDGKPAFKEDWGKWYLTSMCEVDRLMLHTKWNGKEEYMPYPAYFALDDIVVVRRESRTNNLSKY